MDNAVRNDLLRIYQAALKRVSGFDAVKRRLEQRPLQGEHRLIAIGKAAASMSLGALAAGGDLIKAGLLITKHGHLEANLDRYPQVHCLESDHPVPGQASLAAGARLLEFIEQSPPDARFLFLISGGASSLAEVLTEGMDLETLRKLTDALLAGGLSITKMNQVRRSISRIKGGRLAAYLKGRKTLCLLISDVPGDDPAVIGSGPLVHIRGESALEGLPENVTRLLAKTQLVAPPDERVFEAIETDVIAKLEDAKIAAAAEAKRLGYAAKVYPEFLEGDAAQAAQWLSRRLIDAANGVHIWGGETAVTLPPDPGRGGRNQHLALSAAVALRGRQDVYLLAAGTDGTDGPTEDAGALIDGDTVSRGEESGLSAEDALRRADGGTFLEASGDLIRTGPSGTNVMDLVIGLKK
ncbi:MAG: glycerate kinase type-2 family protein [Gammaproteobacteria bacterium]